MGDILMPSLGADMDHGKIVEWLVKPGDYVRRGDLVAVVDTDKTVMDIESFQEGVVAELLVGLNQTVPVGTPVARITQTPAEVPGPTPAAPPASAAGPGAVVPPVASPAPESSGPSSPPQPPGPPPVAPPVRHLAHRLGVDTDRIHGTGRDGAITRADVEHAAAARPGPARAAAGQPEQGQSEPGAMEPGRVRAAPRARRLAAELGVDLSALAGTGPDGAVTVPDVQGAAETRTVPVAPELTEQKQSWPEQTTPEPPAPAQPAAPETPATDRTAALRRAIGSLMSRSKQTIPHYYLSATLDLRAAMDWMQHVNAQRPVAARLVASALLLKAAALAARDVPEVNGFYVDDEFRPSPSVHLGVAVALRHGGLVAPALHDADTLTVDELMAQLRDLVGRARAGRLQRAEMADPTLTVTNLGDLGVDSVFGVIYPPQVALLGLGRVQEQPWAENGMLGVRHAVTATLSADHRVSDGLRGGRYLARIGELLQAPEEL
ncbi:dihydrolipoamide acetyltransferase family protein [Pseudarthrobacter sp. L19]|uniref:dihydrolipoamide acetyltransferase family protein n=1 Tax=Pseudarthrobacter sp. L19 TaxID=3423951 RepID=UPI003D7B27F4